MHKDVKHQQFLEKVKTALSPRFQPGVPFIKVLLNYISLDIHWRFLGYRVHHYTSFVTNFNASTHKVVPCKIFADRFLKFDYFRRMGYVTYF